jgi:hypothetical protein
MCSPDVPIHIAIHVFQLSPDGSGCPLAHLSLPLAHALAAWGETAQQGVFMGSWDRKSGAEQDGTKTGSIWAEDANRRQARPLIGCEGSTPALPAEAGWVPIASAKYVSACHGR